MAPDADSYGTEVADMALELVNQMLTDYGGRFSNRCLGPIGSLADIQSCVVKREEGHIDITAYITLVNGRNIALIIENKVGAHESRQGQLVDYFRVGMELTNANFAGRDSEIVYIYLKSDYDFEDPLIRCDGKGNRIDTGFSKLDWKAVYLLFGNRKLADSILKSYSSWISSNRELIEQSLDVANLLSPGGQEILKRRHMAQVALIRSVFSRLIGEKKPCSFENQLPYIRIRYDCDTFILIGTDRGSPWTSVWRWKKGEMDILYRLQIHYQGDSPEPRLHLKTYSQEKQKDVEEKARISDLYKELIEKYKLSDIWSDTRRWSPGGWETDIGSFILVGNSIERLKRIEDLHEEFVQKAGLTSKGKELCKQQA